MIEAQKSDTHLIWDCTEGRYSMDEERRARMRRADEIDLADGSPDELEELIVEMTAKDPDFPRMLEEAIERRTWMHALVQGRKRRFQ